MTTSGATNGNERQRVITNDNESENEWKQMKANESK